MQIISNIKVKFHIFSIMAITGPSSLIGLYSEGASAVVLLYDKADKESFIALQNILSEVNKHYFNAFKAIIAYNSNYENVQVNENEMEKLIEDFKATPFEVFSGNEAH